MRKKHLAILANLEIKLFEKSLYRNYFLWINDPEILDFEVFNKILLNSIFMIFPFFIVDNIIYIHLA